MEHTRARLCLGQQGVVALALLCKFRLEGRRLRRRALVRRGERSRVRLQKLFLGSLSVESGALVG
jgi:hypothetical protein